MKWHTRPEITRSRRKLIRRIFESAVASIGKRMPRCYHGEETIENAKPVEQTREREREVKINSFRKSGEPESRRNFDEGSIDTERSTRRTRSHRLHSNAIFSLVLLNSIVSPRETVVSTLANCAYARIQLRLLNLRGFGFER